jgi:hypothetical protein
LRTEADLIAALATLESQAPDADEVLAAVRRRLAAGHRSRLAALTGVAARAGGAPIGKSTRWHPGPAIPGRTRLIAPLAAAAAVAAVAVAAALVTPGTQPAQRAVSGGAAGWNGAVPSGSLGTITATSGPSRFFFAFQRNGLLIHGLTFNPLAVYSTATGRLIGSLATPHWLFSDGHSVAAATADDRAFIVSNSAGPGTLSACHRTTTLYRLDLSKQGLPDHLTRLALPVIHGDVTALAATPDGRKVAYVTSACQLPFDEVSVLGVINTATGQRTQWTWPTPGVEVRSLSISADGRLIEYLANPNKVINPEEGLTLDQVNTVGLVLANSPSGSVLRYGRTVLHWSGRPFGSSAVTSDGQHLYYCTAGKASGSLSAVLLQAYQVATGTTTKLATYHSSSSFCELAMSGKDLLLDTGTDAALVSHVTRYDLTTGKTSPVPLRRAWIGLAAW